MFVHTLHPCGVLYIPAASKFFQLLQATGRESLKHLKMPVPPWGALNQWLTGVSLGKTHPLCPGAQTILFVPRIPRRFSLTSSFSLLLSKRGVKSSSISQLKKRENAILHGILLPFEKSAYNKFHSHPSSSVTKNRSPHTHQCTQGGTREGAGTVFCTSNA